MDDLSRLANIRALTAILNPVAFRERMDDWTRGGLPGASMASGSPAAEKPAPMLDGTDVRLTEALRAYGGILRDCHQLLEKARVLETAVLPDYHMSNMEWNAHRARMSRLALDEVSARAQPCANAHCGRSVERTAKDPLIKGRCRNCHAYQNAHGGKERPKDLCVQDIERQMTRKQKSA